MEAMRVQDKLEPEFGCGNNTGKEESDRKDSTEGVGQRLGE